MRSNIYAIRTAAKAAEAEKVAALIGSGHPHAVGQMVMNFMALMSSLQLYAELLDDSLFWDRRNPAGLPVLAEFHMFELGFKDSEYYRVAKATR